MYSVRDLELVTVAANLPDEKPSVQRMLDKMHATSRNLLFASEDTAALQAAFDPTWQSAVPYTVLIAPAAKCCTRSRVKSTFWSCAAQFSRICRLSMWVQPVLGSGHKTFDPKEPLTAKVAKNTQRAQRTA